MDSIVHLQLDVPDELIDLGVHRAIEYLTQPIVFSRVDPMGDRTAPTRLPSPNDVVYSLRLTSWVHWNHLFDVYRATVMSNDPLDPLHCRKIMIKFMGTGTFGECTEYQSSDDAVEAVYHEAKMFEKYLSKMEGTTVPAYYGLFAITVELHEDWHEDVLTMVLEDVSEPICEHYDSPYLGVETDVGNEVIALFKHLHSHGIIRRQVEYGGVSRRPEGNRKLAIVDFNHAGYIGRSERAVRSLNREMRYVKWYLHTLRPGHPEADPDDTDEEETDRSEEEATVLAHNHA